MQLGARLLSAGTDPNYARWSIRRAFTFALDVVVDASKEIAEQVRDSNPDFVCGIRASGGPLGALLAYWLDVPFYWFVDASDQFLFPKHVPLRDSRVIVVDSHALTGVNLSRHVEILWRMGVRIDSAWVLLDCDTLRDPVAAKQLQMRVGGVRSLWTLTELVNYLRIESQSESHTLKVVEAISAGGMGFWRMPTFQS